ncbi:hypothetical protein T8K17_07615 [Thalassobaculum sp. OXR-137]|uniref:hypothetical protein n=1 Tax=Thalassobaculum sp. OXR-137 TaxID=3100173 RepID=UPI002AC8AB5D|nr:hypothetical protein [Thalassobaculum sp. OXR-137]WPZ36001.1 hypothetical protein T8K17_07615 [Thalassobaculum sp. OXR-137]
MTRGLLFLRLPFFLAAALMLFAAVPASAQWLHDAQPAPAQPNPVHTVPAEPSVLPDLRADLPPWQRTLYKTVTFQAVANATDLLLFDTLIGGHAVLLGGFVVANAATAAGLYYGFEYLWQREGPTLAETDETTILKKSLLFQSVNGGRIFLLGYGLGASAPAAALLAGTVFVTDLAVFYANEYVWDVLRPLEVGSTAEPPITASSIPVSYR